MEYPQTLLFVEDYTSGLLAGKLYFEDNGFAVIDCETEPMALHELDTNGEHIDAVVTDRELGEKDCYTIVEAAHDLGIFAVVFTAIDATPRPYHSAPVVIKPNFEEVLAVLNSKNIQL